MRLVEKSTWRWLAGVYTIIIILFIVSAAWGALSLMPPPRAQFLDNSGKVLSGGRIDFFDAGTTTRKNTYADSAGSNVNPNPVVLGTSGAANIWLDGLYKVRVNSSANATLYTVDNVSAMPYTANSFTEWISLNLTPTYQTATAFLVVGDYTSTLEPGRRLKTVDTGGTDYSTVSTSTYSGGNTTVNIFPDSGSLDSGLSSIAVGILTITNPSKPIPPTVTKVATDQTLTVADVLKSNPVLYSSASAGNITIPAANAVPSGTKLEVHNAGPGSTYVIGTVSGTTNPWVSPKQTLRMVGDGNLWHGDSSRVFGTSTLEGLMLVDCTSSILTNYMACTNALFNTGGSTSWVNDGGVNQTHFRVPSGYTYFRVCYNSVVGSSVTAGASNSWIASVNWVAATNVVSGGFNGSMIHSYSWAARNTYGGASNNLSTVDTCSRYYPASSWATANFAVWVNLLSSPKHIFMELIK